MVTVKNRLNELMNERGLKQDKLAAELGITPGTVSRWVRNQVDRYDRDTLEKIIDYFDCGIQDILIVEGVPKNRKKK